MEFLTKFNNFPTSRFAGADFGNDLPGKSQAHSRAILGPFSRHNTKPATHEKSQVAEYQCAPLGARTLDTLIKSQVLYQLS